MSEDDYLQEGFDPSSITVPRLRSILVTHNVPYLSTAKKPQLIDIFNQQVVPLRSGILADRALARRSSRGIVDAHSSQDTTSGSDAPGQFDSDDHDLLPPQPLKNTRRSRSPKKAPVPVREGPDKTPAPRKTGRSVTRTAQPSDAEDDQTRSVKRNTRTATPKIKQESDDELHRPVSREASLVDEDDNPFSSENPFQSGSSPLQQGNRSVRRKTAGADAAKKRPSSGFGRITEGPPPGALDGFVPDAHQPPERRVASSRYDTPLIAPSHTPAAALGTYDDSGHDAYQAPPRRAVSSRYDSPVIAPPPHQTAAPDVGDDPGHDAYQAPAPARRAASSRYDSPAIVTSHAPAAAPNVRTVTKSTRSFQVPMSQLKKKLPARVREPAAPSLEPGEEFTPDEQLALDQAEAGDRRIVVSRRKPMQRKTSSWATGVWALLVALSVAYLAWYRNQKIEAGFCGISDGKPHRLITPDIAVPDWLEPYVEPTCQPCPKHATCYSDFSVRCHNDFISKPHPLSFWGLVPLPPTCEPDGEKVLKIKTMADRAVEELRERRAVYECGLLPVDDAADGPEIEAQRLKSNLHRQKSKKLSTEEFEDLWSAAIGEVKARDEVEVTEKNLDSSGFPHTYLSSSSLARLPLTCALKRSVRVSLERHRLAIGSVMATIALFFWGRAYYRRHAAIVAQVPGLVDIVLSRLASQRDLGEEDLDDPFLFQPHLRDDVLRSIHLLKDRERIWTRVKDVVEQNANVRISQREGRNGEVGRAWEWIGPTSEAGSARRRRTGRTSLGPDVRFDEMDSVPAREVEVKREEGDRSRAVSSRWDEGKRPIF